MDGIQGDDIYVWVMEEYNSPITMEEIDGKIYQTKTYYLINKQKYRYSILQVIFYDDEKNVLKNYSYNHDTDNADYKYNSPIIEGTTVDAVLLKCLGLMNQQNQSK